MLITLPEDAVVAGGGVGDADVVAFGLAHFVDAVEADEQGGDDDALAFVALALLEFAADEVVEELVGAAHFDVGVDADGVPALEQGVEEFVDGDGSAGLVAFGEGVAFEHLADGFPGGEFDDIKQVEFAEPFAVSADFEQFLFRAEDFHDLGEVGVGVAIDFFAAEDGPGGVSAGGVANAGGVVADDDDGFVAPVLELADDLERDAVTEVDIGRRGVHAEFDAEGFARGRGVF